MRSNLFSTKKEDRFFATQILSLALLSILTAESAPIARAFLRTGSIDDSPTDTTITSA